MKTNESIIDLNLSSSEGVNRNRMTKKAAILLKEMLIENQFIEHLKMTGVSVGDEGML